jgi:hypothetical protein
MVVRQLLYRLEGWPGAVAAGGVGLEGIDLDTLRLVG